MRPVRRCGQWNLEPSTAGPDAWRLSRGRHPPSRRRVMGRVGLVMTTKVGEVVRPGFPCRSCEQPVRTPRFTIDSRSATGAGNRASDVHARTTLTRQSRGQVPPCFGPTESEVVVGMAPAIRGVLVAVRRPWSVRLHSSSFANGHEFVTRRRELRLRIETTAFGPSGNRTAKMSVSPCERSGGCGIRTREGVNPTRFPSPLKHVRNDS
jgi:hypothetical protein